MIKTYKIKVFDSYQSLPENPWKNSIIDFEKSYAVKWFAIFTYDEETIVGFSRVLRNPDDVSNWYICDVYTATEYRRMGIATKMYETAFKLVKEYEAASSITASISASNTPSICMHYKLGFRDTTKTSAFANFWFEANETIYALWLSDLYPARNTSIHLDLLQPMWLNYMKEIGEQEPEEALLSGLQKRIDLSQNNDLVFFDIIWSGNTAIGFAYYSIDVRIKYLIPPGYGCIMEFYLHESWRKRGIGSNIVNQICNKLKRLNCPKIYLTPVLQSKSFWENTTFIDSGLIDPDNNMSIFIKDVTQH